MLSNPEIAEIFFEIADILDIQNVDFKPVAYRKAAKNIESLSVSVYEIYKEKGIKGLEDIPGVGKHIALKIEEIIKTGNLAYLSKLKKQLPKDIYKLMDIPGVGPKKIARLYKELKIKNISDLKKALKKHTIAELKGFGEKSEQDIAEGLKFAKQKQRMLLGEAYPIAYSIKQELLKLKEVERVDIAGSLARMKETIGDIDILCISRSNKKVMAAFTSLGRKILAKGETKSSIILQDNVQVDLRVLPKKEYGSALQYFIGSKEHSVHLRNIAIKKGYKLSEYGLFTRDNKLIESKDEKAIYKKLGLQWPAFELRENRGEIEAAQQNKLPKLVGYDEIKGDLHMHTKYSDGGHSIKEMTDYCKDKLKYEYIAITDHSQSQIIANGMKVKKLLKQLKEIDGLNKDYSKFRIFKSSEVDIKADGSLDYEDSILKKLDLIIASVHSGFKHNNTERILKAMDNKYVRIIGHLTGRLLNERNPYPVDVEKVFQKAHDNDVWIEVNTQPSRLDINDTLIRKAVDMKVKMVINTDSHSVDGLNNMMYGIAQARRGWAEKKDIINTVSLKKFEKLL